MNLIILQEREKLSMKRFRAKKALFIPKLDQRHVNMNFFEQRLMHKTTTRRRVMFRIDT